jgi:hypothetical protein
MTLPWMNLLRERLSNKMKIGNYEINQYYSDSKIIMEFIKPIMEYGEAEEKRITEEFFNNEISLKNEKK